MVYTEGEIKDLAMGFFQKLFTSGGVGDLTHILSRISISISIDMNKALAVDFTEEEVYYVLKEMGLTKASGFDGFLTMFFQKY